MQNKLDLENIKFQENNINIGILTSGGDAQGMNAAVRGVTRVSIYMGATVFAISNGYQGMVDNMIYPLSWKDVDVLGEGGTFIGTARCSAFRTREGRKMATKNLLKHSINRLVVIGGDGSLTGAQILYNEWPELVQEIIEEEKKNKNSIFNLTLLETLNYLVIVGLVGSIDNDMCGTDLTIGADTALNRIIQAVDGLSCTAASHQREFVVEVMGRDCGWLALFGAVATGADWVLIPEAPVGNDWKEKIVQSIKNGKAMGRKSSIVIIAEGAKDINGKIVTSLEVKQALDAGGFDARITILGHIQRGGNPLAYDRYMSTIIAAKAAQLVITGKEPPCLVGVVANKVSILPIETCLKMNKELRDAIEKKDFTKAMKLRGYIFKEIYDIMKIITRAIPNHPPEHIKKICIGIMHVGACSPGMNACVRAIVRLAKNHGHKVLGIKDGFDGLWKDDVIELNWMSVNGWAKQGGAKLGTRRVDVNTMDCQKTIDCLHKYGIQGLIIIGGWDGYTAVLKLEKYLNEHLNIKKIPIVLVPSSISNNLPCTLSSIGDDTALNNIIEAVDKIKQSAASSSRIFVVEVMGTGGYLPTLAGLSTGADRVYTNNEKITLGRLQSDINAFKNLFEKNNNGIGRTCLVINNEKSSKVFTTSTLAALFEDQGNGKYKVGSAVLGHLQQGGSPSGADRIFATILGSSALHIIEEQNNHFFQGEIPNSGCVGIVKGGVKFTPLSEMENEMDFINRIPKETWWKEYSYILSITSNLFYNYKTNSSITFKLDSNL